MKKIISLLLCTVISVLAFSSCSIDYGNLTSSIDTSQVITDSSELSDLLYAASLSQTTGKYNTASEWLRLWGLTGFSSYRLTSVEEVYAIYFIREVPPSLKVAQDMVALIHESDVFSRIDITDSTEVTDMLISCYMLAVGDKYATYFNVEDYASYKSQTTGSYVGIGVSVSYNAISTEMTVTSVFKGSPAEQAGLLPGDIIYTVAGKSVTELTYQGAVSLIRGEEGTDVTITVLRGSTEMEFTVSRRQVTEETVTHRIIEQSGKKTGYIRITSFSEVTFEQFKTAVDSVVASGAQGIIFDMRANPGGLLTAVLSMLDYILPDGQPLANYVYYNGSTDTSKGEDGHAVNLPFVVICNEYTASAGELFTCALQDYDRAGLIDAKVVGTTTYGKGTMQSLLEFSDHKTAMTISLAYYQPPFSENYEGKGIVPDTLSELDEQYRGKSVYLLTEDEDAQLAAAVSDLLLRIEND